MRKGGGERNGLHGIEKGKARGKMNVMVERKRLQKREKIAERENEMKMMLMK